MTQLRTGSGLPVLREQALYGLPGDVVRGLSPYTEAADVALLGTYLAYLSAAVGSKAYLHSGDRHPAIVSLLLCGPTSAGRKGTSERAIARLWWHVNPWFLDTHVKTGLTTGAGLVHHVRDAAPPTPKQQFLMEQMGKSPQELDLDPGVADKRLLIVEDEFRSVLAAGKTDQGSSLLTNLRLAWDGRTMSSLLASKDRVATRPHIVVVGMITPGELLTYADSADIAGGTVNRFLLLRTAFSKLLPRTPPTPRHILENLAQRTTDALWAIGSEDASAPPKKFDYTPEAGELWDALYTGPLAPTHDDSVLTQVTARGSSHVARLSLVYAIADGCDAIEREHVAAAAALWDYSVASARMTFATGDLGDDPDMKRLEDAFRAAGTEGMTRTQVSEVFGRNKQAAELDRLLANLVATRAIAAGPRPEGSKHPIHVHASHSGKEARISSAS